MGTEAGAEQSPFGAGTLRKIIHIDMDAFYASVEQRDNPELRGKPVAVGGSRERGVVAAASYEARAFGVHSAMPSITAKRKCPDLIFVKPRFDAYKAISLQIREIFAAYTPIIEPLSLDEAYLDVTENLKGISLATQIAEEIRARIRAEIEITASAGVSYNKFLAKLASDHRKPDGLFVITPKMGPSFVETLPVRKFHGIGPATARKMAQLGIETGLDLKGQTLEFLQHHFSKAGAYDYWAARGIDERLVRADRIRKSVGAENTFPADLLTYEAARDALACRNRRQGVGVLRGLRHARPHRHPLGEVRQLSDHHAQPHRSNAGQDAGRTRRSRQRVARTAFSGGERHPAPRHLPVFTRAGGGGTRARIQPACLERDPVRLKHIRHWRGN
jgi:DNA polymerase-4